VSNPQARQMLRAGVTSTFRACAGVRNFATYKTSTGLVGLAVDPEGATTLLKISQKALDSVKVM
jgi:hypothetical protein